MTDPTQQHVRGTLNSAERPEPTDEWRPPGENATAEAPGHRKADVSDEQHTAELPATAAPAAMPDEPTPPRRPAPARSLGLKPGSRLRGAANATTGTWIGVVLVAAGFAAIFYTWGKVAGLLNVAQQLPYLVSGGLAGLALIIIGVTVIDVAVRRQDSYERRQQLSQMTRTLAELRELFEAEDSLDDRDGEA